mmetsp:Transcript_98813/g.264249  ORF Transcript_98813/g.264249 Transcript_98813/m.264249 type:complete len:227 (+) Transcript_98813:387-1067(+)
MHGFPHVPAKLSDVLVIRGLPGDHGEDVVQRQHGAAVGGEGFMHNPRKDCHAALCFGDIIQVRNHSSPSVRTLLTNSDRINMRQVLLPVTIPHDLQSFQPAVLGLLQVIQSRVAQRPAHAGDHFPSDDPDHRVVLLGIPEIHAIVVGGGPGEGPGDGLIHVVGRVQPLLLGGGHNLVTFRRREQVLEHRDRRLLAEDDHPGLIVAGAFTLGAPHHSHGGLGRGEPP